MALKENLIDIAMIVSYLVTLSFDQNEVCNDWCVIMYQPTLILMFVVMIRHLRLESNLSFILEMLVMTVKELKYFLHTYVLLLILFCFIFYIQGLYNVNEGLENVWLLGAFIMTVQESLGNFGTV